jgi:hypothetical protein
MTHGATGWALDADHFVQWIAGLSRLGSLGEGEDLILRLDAQDRFYSQVRKRHRLLGQYEFGNPIASAITRSMISRQTSSVMVWASTSK